MKNKDKNEKLKIDQLYPERTFLDYCCYDEHRTRKITGNITSELLRSFEKDGLIIPLTKNKGLEKQQDGTDKEIDLYYYSPFQIFLVSALSKNIINEEGLPANFDVADIEYQKIHNARYVSWGDQMSFNASQYKNPIYQQNNDFNAYELSKDFHNLLKFIHSFETTRTYQNLKPERNRYYNNLPSFQYDFEPIKNTIKAELKKYDLSIDKIKRIKLNVASHTTHIDPLEQWYYYIEKHPQWRKDKLKGTALLAQDLYGFCQIIDDIVEISTREKPKPLLELLHPDIKPMGYTGVEHASGTDLVMIKDVYNEINKWLKKKKNKELLDWILETQNGDENWIKTKKELLEVKNELLDYEKRYGEKRYLGGFMRIVHPEKELKLSDLDNKTKWYVENIINQRREHGLSYEKNGKTFLRTEYDDVVELWKKGKKDEALEKNLDYEREYEITRAIENRLDDIVRKIMGVCSWIDQALWAPHYKITHEKEVAQPNLWFEFNKNNKQTDPDYAKKHAEFWHKKLKQGLKEWDDKLERIKYAQAELYGFIKKIRLVYCAVCRKKLVQLHHEQGDRLANPEQICDECLLNTSDYKKIKLNEWKCEDCGKLIYKFAHGNILSDVLFNTASATIHLEYGEATIEATCPNKDCKKKQSRTMNWGWKP